MSTSLSPIKDEQISVNAVKVVNHLTAHGYQAYLVGGCIRDLLLGKSPKDFDVATSAHPEEIRKLFRNSRIIGRRFKIVHVRFGREIVEVTTFRGAHGEQYDKNHSDTGMTLSDNIYGTFTKDVFRRDFTMNAVYYQPKSRETLDPANGMADIQAKRISTMGDPWDRFREDPVRMLRAVRFKAKLQFEIEDEVCKAIESLGYLVQDVSRARLFDEVLKLFLSGHGSASFDTMMAHDLYGWLFPDSKRSMADNATEELVRLALTSTDERMAKGLPVMIAFIYAAILWYPFIEEKERLQQEEGIPHATASQEAANNILAKQQLFTSIPKRVTGFIRDIWYLQFRLPTRFGSKPDYLMENRRFRAAYDFLLLREAAGEETDKLGGWWTEYQEANEARRQEMKQPAGNKKQRKRRKRRAQPNAPVNERDPGRQTR